MAFLQSSLKYFLSYYIQYLAHQPNGSVSEILLMDEPDAYLSSQAQQDLLKIFEAFSRPLSKDREPVQVVYVTHSPFLIDKNSADGIRVLEKGRSDEGTRVVKNASRNHYEPLRSAFGSFVGESTFIGNCNLFVEGTSDQILLAGATRILRKQGAAESHTLDLNHLTIVPAGSASQIPYMVYLARGRDYERPAVIVLLDADSEGKEAKKRLLGKAPIKKQRMREEYVVLISDISSEIDSIPSTAKVISDIEDLIPLDICIEATRRYFSEIPTDQRIDVSKITASSVQGHLNESNSILDAILNLLSEIQPETHIDKIGFSRNVIFVVEEWISKREHHEAIGLFLKTFKKLCSKLYRIQRKASQECNQERIANLVARLKASFFRDYPDNAKAEDAVLLLEDIENVLDDSDESDEIKRKIDVIRRSFKLFDDPSSMIDNFDAFQEQVSTLEYSDRLLSHARDSEGITI